MLAIIHVSPADLVDFHKKVASIMKYFISNNAINQNVLYINNLDNNPESILNHHSAYALQALGRDYSMSIEMNLSLQSKKLKYFETILEAPIERVTLVGPCGDIESLVDYDQEDLLRYRAAPNQFSGEFPWRTPNSSLFKIMKRLEKQSFRKSDLIILGKKLKH